MNAAFSAACMLGILVAAPACAQKSRAAAPIAAPSSAAAPASAPAVDRTDRADLDRTPIIGNRELPKVLYIVPWKKPLPGDLSGRPPVSVLDEALAPVDRDVFRREVRYDAQATLTSGAGLGLQAEPAQEARRMRLESPPSPPRPLPQAGEGAKAK